MKIFIFSSTMLIPCREFFFSAENPTRLLQREKVLQREVVSRINCYDNFYTFRVFFQQITLRMANHEQSFLGNVLFPVKREIELPRRNSDSCKCDFSFIIKTLNYSYCCLFYFQLFFFIAGLCHPTHK